MTDWLPIIAPAWIAGTLLALLSAPLGCLVLWRRMAFFADTLAHGALLGVAIAAWLSLPADIGIILVSMLVVAALVFMNDKRLPNDATLSVMAAMLFDPPNFLILDEPTNHLDLDTKEMLIKALSEYEGTMLFVSHDRHFLAALSNRVLELTPDGIHQYGGGYTEYVERTGHEAPGLRS